MRSESGSPLSSNWISALHPLRRSEAGNMPVRDVDSLSLALMGFEPLAYLCGLHNIQYSQIDGQFSVS